MSRRSRGTASRGEINEQTDRSQNDMREKEGDMEKIVDDCETVRATLASLEFGGTTEGADAVEVAMNGANDVTENAFEHDDQQLEGIQHESEGHQSDLQERSDSEDGDVEKMSGASGRITTTDTVNELNKAKDACLRDIDFLVEQIKRAETARTESERVQQEYQQRVHTHGR